MRALRQIISPAQIGQKWDMVVDGTGGITHFEIVAAPTPDHTDAVNLSHHQDSDPSLLATLDARCGVLVGHAPIARWEVGR
jgi:hypothetical protein